MKKVLLLLSTTRHSPEGIRAALDKAMADSVDLVVAFILDDELPGHILQKLSDEGWIGGKPSDELYAAILREYTIQGQAKLDEVAERAREAGVAVHTTLLRGNFVEKALEIIETEKVATIIVNRRKRSNLSRFLFGSPVAELKRRAPCPVVIVDEE